MKRITTFSIATLALSAALYITAAGQNQNTVSYSYDNAGNRTARTTTGPDLTRSGGRTKSKSSTKRFITVLPSGQGWDKMQYVYRNNTQYGINYLDYGNNLITVHYYQKTVNGFTYKSGFKFKY